LAKLKYDINEIWRNCVGTHKMAHFTATIWYTISSDINSNKTDTNNFTFSANITQRIRSLSCLCENPASLTKCYSLNQYKFRDSFLRYVFIRLRIRNTGEQRREFIIRQCVCRLRGNEQYAIYRSWNESLNT